MVLSILGAAGYDQAGQPADADVVLLNTCAIREQAEHKVAVNTSYFLLNLHADVCLSLS